MSTPWTVELGGGVSVKNCLLLFVKCPFQVSEEEEDDGSGKAAPDPEAVLKVLGRARVHHVVDQEAEIEGGGLGAIRVHATVTVR